MEGASQSVHAMVTGDKEIDAMSLLIAAMGEMSSLQSDGLDQLQQARIAAWFYNKYNPPLIRLDPNGVDAEMIGRLITAN